MVSIIGKLARSIRLIIVACIVASAIPGCSTARSRLAAPTSTPCPALELDIVNPNLNIEVDAQRARDILKMEAKRWTEVEIHHALAGPTLLLGRRFSNIEYYLVYFSPQLIQAAVLDISASRNYTIDQRKQLLASVSHRLSHQGELPLLLVVRSDQLKGEVHLASLEEKMILVNLHGEEVRPSRYDRNLDDPLQLADVEMKVGFVFFPLRFGDCRPTVDLHSDSSFTVAFRDARFQTEWGTEQKDLSWRFSLVDVDKSVVDLLNVPVAMPAEIEETFGAKVLWFVIESVLDYALGKLLP